MAIETEITKYLLDGLDPEEAKFASTVQFRIVRNPSEASWASEPEPAAANPTFLNGTLLLSSSLLKEGDLISIGPEKMKLLVRIEWSA